VTSSHVLFIPGVLMIGMFLGFIIGARAARNQFDLQRKREQEREAVRAARAAKKTEQSAKSEPSESA
jgi:DNA invertase Pin-like site-specific DNA recombinase